MEVLILYSICKKSGIGPSLVNHIHTSTLTNTLQLSRCSYSGAGGAWIVSELSKISYCPRHTSNKQIFNTFRVLQLQQRFQAWWCCCCRPECRTSLSSSETKQLDSISGQGLIWSAARDHPTSRFIEFNKAQHNKKWSQTSRHHPLTFGFFQWSNQPVLTGNK